MPMLYLIGEDALSCSLGEKLAIEIGWTLAQPAVNTKGVTKLRSSIPRYIGLARISPVFCLADTDGRCVLELLRNWRIIGAPAHFLLRFAVQEIESWILADRRSFSEFFRVAEARISRHPDDLVDAKQEVLNLARSSRRREIRTEVVSALDPSKPGAGYNVHMRDFVLQYWHAREAAQASPSLARALHRLKELLDKQE